MRFLGGQDAKNSRRVAGDDAVGWNIPGHDAPCADDGPFADDDVRQDGCAGTNRRARLYNGGLDLPVALRFADAPFELVARG